MDLNEYNAILQQLASTPGLQDRLRKQMGINQALGVIHENAAIPGTAGSQFTLKPEYVEDLAITNNRRIQNLPYQIGVMPGQAWPGDPNYKGLHETDPNTEAEIIRYMKDQLGFSVPRFSLPSAPPLP